MQRGGISDVVTASELRNLNKRNNLYTNYQASKGVAGSRNAFDTNSSIQSGEDESFTIGGGTNKGIGLRERLLLKRKDTYIMGSNLGLVANPTIEEIFNGRGNQGQQKLVYDWEEPVPYQVSGGVNGMPDSIVPYGIQGPFFPEVEDADYKLKQKSKNIKFKQELYVKGTGGTSLAGGSSKVDYSQFSIADEPIATNTGRPYYHGASQESVRVLQENQAKFANGWYLNRVKKTDEQLARNKRSVGAALGTL